MAETNVDDPIARCDPKVFLILHAHPGWKYNLGRVPSNAAATHRKEISNNEFPEQPEFSSSCDQAIVKYCNNVNAPEETDVLDYIREDQSQYADASANALTEGLEKIIQSQRDGSIKYLAIFCHSGHLSFSDGSFENASFLHPASAAWSNLYKANISVFDPNKFDSQCQIRNFGCYAGFGSDSICEQLATHIPGSTVYGFNSDGGACGTNDRDIGHGLKPLPDPIPDPTQGDTWFVTYSPGARSIFRKFP